MTSVLPPSSAGEGLQRHPEDPVRRLAAELLERRVTIAVPRRQVRAVFDDETVRVYQAYAPEIAGPALAAQRFVAPFKRERMTWVKPSFLWMAYRCGWGRKPGQEQVLAVKISRAGFESALARSCPSHYDPAGFPGMFPDEDAWRARRDATTVRVQWDPERDLRLQPLAHRSVQLGLGGPVVREYVDEWIVVIDDVTQQMRAVEAAVAAGDVEGAAGLLPPERPYPLPADVAAVVGGAAVPG